MSRRISPELLRRIRNEIPIRVLMAHRLALTWKVADDEFRFLCPICSDFHTATNPKTNLGRCFRCKRNFNPIDITMIVEACSFREAVDRLREQLE